MAEEFLNNPVPGFHDGDSFDPGDELMYSANGMTQKGVTVAGGQGVLETGTVLARGTDKKYYEYGSAAATTAGATIANGVLRRSINTDAAGGADQLANIVIMGILKNNLVKGADAAAVTALGAVVDADRNTFKL